MRAAPAPMARAIRTILKARTRRRAPKRRRHRGARRPRSTRGTLSTRGARVTSRPRWRARFTCATAAVARSVRRTGGVVVPVDFWSSITSRLGRWGAKRRSRICDFVVGRTICIRRGDTSGRSAFERRSRRSNDLRSLGDSRAPPGGILPIRIEQPLPAKRAGELGFGQRSAGSGSGGIVLLPSQCVRGSSGARERAVPGRSVCSRGRWLGTRVRASSPESDRRRSRRAGT